MKDNELILFYTTLECERCSDEFLFILFPLRNSNRQFGVEHICARCIQCSDMSEFYAKPLARLAEDEYLRVFPNIKFGIKRLTAFDREFELIKEGLSINEILNCATDDTDNNWGKQYLKFYDKSLKGDPKDL